MLEYLFVLDVATFLLEVILDRILVNERQMNTIEVQDREECWQEYVTAFF